MRISQYEYKDHINEKVWVHRFFHDNIISPTEGMIGAYDRIYRIGSKGNTLKTEIPSTNTRLYVFTDKQECIDDFIKWCQMEIDKYNSLIQQTNNL